MTHTVDWEYVHTCDKNITLYSCNDFLHKDDVAKALIDTECVWGFRKLLEICSDMA